MERTIAGGITKDTTLCISLSGRPGNTGTRFHNFLYDALGLDYVYKAFTTTDIAAAIAGVRGLGIRGAAISMPWKEDVIALVDEMSPSAAAIESVNTIVNTDGHLAAYNTDYIAIATLVREHEVPTSLAVAVLGSGGMAKATVAALRDSGFADGRVIARNRVSGPALAEKYGWSWAPSLDDAPTADMIVNCTPVGMAGGPEAELLPISDDALHAASVIFDVVALPERTPLIIAAEAAGKTVISGAEVMSLQALEQFVLYTGVRPEPDVFAAATAFSRRQ